MWLVFKTDLASQNFPAYIFYSPTNILCDHTECKLYLRRIKSPSFRRCNEHNCHLYSFLRSLVTIMIKDLNSKASNVIKAPFQQNQIRHSMKKMQFRQKTYPQNTLFISPCCSNTWALQKKAGMVGGLQWPIPHPSNWRWGSLHWAPWWHGIILGAYLS